MSNRVTPPCEAEGCRSPGFIACAYRDRAGAECTTHWCSTHAASYAGHRYCRRHADTLAGLSTPFDGTPPLPLVDNRAASLLHWMAGLLEEPVRGLLEERRRALTENLVTDHLGAAGPPKDPDAENREWVRRWQLVEHTTGHATITVSLAVDEADQKKVTVAVNGTPVHTGEPPWIGRGEKTDAGAMKRSRREYLETLVAAIEADLDRQRPVTGR